MCVCILLCLTLWDPMDCSPAGSSVHRILQARILEWVVMPSSKGSSQPRDWTPSGGSCIAGGFFTTEPPWKTPIEHDDYFINTKKRLWQPGTLGERVTRVTWTIPTTFLNVWDFFFFFGLSLPTPLLPPPSFPQHLFQKWKTYCSRFRVSITKQIPRTRSTLVVLKTSLAPLPLHTQLREWKSNWNWAGLCTAFTKAVS